MTFNPYLRHFGNVMKRHLWTKNPQSHFCVKVSLSTFKVLKRTSIYDSHKNEIYAIIMTQNRINFWEDPEYDKKSIGCEQSYSGKL